MTTPETLTTRETAALLNASVRTIQLWVEDGRLKAWKTPGGHRRVLRESIEEMLANRQRACSGGRKYEVLVVVEDAGQCAALASILNNLGSDMRLRVSTNAYEALIRIGERRPDLLVLRLPMTGLDGCQWMQTLDDEPYRQLTRIVVLSALTADELALRGGLPKGGVLLSEPLQVAELLSSAKAAYQSWRTGGE